MVLLMSAVAAMAYGIRARCRRALNRSARRAAPARGGWGGVANKREKNKALSQTLGRTIPI